MGFQSLLEIFTIIDDGTRQSNEKQKQKEAVQEQKNKRRSFVVNQCAPRVKLEVRSSKMVSDNSFSRSPTPKFCNSFSNR
ncbi:hypothetical protein CsSME_00017750 [Camellia sinensis var. sinensis]